MLVSVAAPNIPEGSFASAGELAPEIALEDYTGELAKLSGPRSFEMGPAPEVEEWKGVESRGLIAENIGEYETFDISHVHPDHVPKPIIRDAHLKAGEMIAPLDYRDGIWRISLYHENRYYKAMPVYFTVPIKDIAGETRILDSHARPVEITEETQPKTIGGGNLPAYFVFNPIQNRDIIRDYYEKQLTSEGIKGREEAEIREMGVPEEQKKAWEEKWGETWREEKLAELTARASMKLGEAIGNQIKTIIGETEQMGFLMNIKHNLTYDFHVSELLGLPKHFGIGQIICYIWSFAVFIEVFNMLPAGGTVGTAIKYIIGLGWLAFIGI
jgi:hypothetical protein